MKLHPVLSVAVGGVLAALSFSSCERDYGVDLNDYNNIETIVYSQHVQPIFTKRCATSGCHDAETAEEDLVLDSWESLIKGSENGATVIPFRPEKSHLVFHINTDATLAPVAEPRMPPDAPLSRDEVAFIMRWISEGAKNDFAQVPYSQPRFGRVLVTNQADDEIAVIDANANLLVRMVPVGSLDNRVTPPEAPHNIIVDRFRQVYYVNLIVSGEIWKFSTFNDELLGKLILGGEKPRSPAQIAYSLDGTEGYVTNFDLTKTYRSIQIFDTQTMQVTREVTDQRMLAPHGIVRMLGRKTLWVTCQESDNIAIIEPDETDAIQIVKMGSTVPDFPTSDYQPAFGPYQLVFTSDNSFAYVT